MIVVRIELWPGGDEGRKRLIGQARIANDGSGTAEVGNYDVRLSHSGVYADRPGTWKRGRVEGHRRSLSPYHLVIKALDACLRPGPKEKARAR
jgi:hypothetical protein